VPPRVLDLARHQLTAASWDTWGIDPVGVLLQHGSDADVVRVEDALRTGPTNLRSAAVWSLSSAPPERAERLLDLLSADPDMNVRQGALSVMMQLGMYDMVEQRLLADLENGGMSYGSTEHLLVQLGTPAAMKAVLDRIEGGTRREWNNAISAVASAGRKEHVEELLDLADRTDQPELRQAILQSLIYTDTVDVDAVVDRALATDDPNLHSTAAMALSRSGTERSRELLAELARSDNAMVASSALGSLGQIGGDDAEAALVEALGHPDVAWSAVNGLQNLGTPSARATLLDAARTADDPTVRSAALQTLPHLGAEGANDVLRDALEDADDEVRYSAVGALESVGTTQAAETLAAVLRSGDLDDEQAMPVAQALQRMGGEVAEANADLIAELVPTFDDVDTGGVVEPLALPE
jgi:HEAT repeat protein